MVYDPENCRPALIIEPDQSYGLAVAALFKEEGYCPVLCHNGQSAVEYLHESVPDIILLDLDLLDVAGRLVVRFIRSRPRFSKTRLILLTDSYTDARGRTGSLANLVLEKPVKLELLRRLIERY